MKNSRKHIAAGVTVVALGALATVALASDGNQSTDRSAPQVRTEAVHRSAERSAVSTATPAPTAEAAHHQRGRGTDDAGVDDHGGRPNDDAGVHHRRGRGTDDSGSDDHGNRGRGADDSGSGDHGHGGHDD